MSLTARLRAGVILRMNVLNNVLSGCKIMSIKILDFKSFLDFKFAIH